MHYGACCDSGRVGGAIFHCGGIGLITRYEWRSVKGGLTGWLGRCGVGWRVRLNHNESLTH